MENKGTMNRFSLKGKVAVVTGGAGMLGYHSACALAEAGADVAVCDIPAALERAQSVAREIAETYRVNARAYGCDLRDEAAVEEMFQTIAREMGSVDVVHSNAGVGGSRTPDHETPLSDWMRVLEGNLVTMFLVDTAAVRVMIRQGHGGSIINTCSMGGHCVMQGPAYETFDNSAYGVSKAGALYFTKSLASQVIRYGIRVNSISPGHIAAVQTKQTKGGQLADSSIDQATAQTFQDSQPAKRTCSVDELMGGIVYLASDASSYCVGTDLLIDGGHTLW